MEKTHTFTFRYEAPLGICNKHDYYKLEGGKKEKREQKKLMVIYTWTSCSCGMRSVASALFWIWNVTWTETFFCVFSFSCLCLYSCPVLV